MASTARKITINYADLPDWVPDSVRHLGGKIVYLKFRFSKAERNIFRKRKPVSPSKWAEKHRYITSGPLEGGRWSNSLTPYLKGIMDASFFPSVRVIINCKAVQVGGTTVMETCLGYAADRRPGPALVVYPDRGTARENNRDNLQPMIKASPRLKSLMTGVDDDIASLRIKLTTMLIYMGWSGSATSLGNKSVKYLILDEVDKYTLTPNKKEAATIDLAEKRNTAYPYDFKRWKNSTPTVESGPIWQALINEAQVIFEYWGKCPDCGEMQYIRFGTKEENGGIRWPEEERDYQKIENGLLAWYECEHCLSHWSDHMRNLAVRNGEWRAKNAGVTQNQLPGLELFKYLRQERPKKIGFHLPAWISPFVSLSECAARFLKGQQDKTALKDFCNNYAAEPWLQYEKERDEDKILTLRDERPRGLVPGNDKIAALVAGCDTQDNGFYYSVFAIGYGRGPDVWLVQEGFVVTLDKLAEVLLDGEYRDAAGLFYPVQFSLLDAMGHRTAEVYDFCRQYPGLIGPAKGERTMNMEFKTSNIEYYPGTSRAIPGGLQLFRVNSTLYKNRASSQLAVAPADPGAVHLHTETGHLYAAHLCAEYRDDSGVWQQIGNRANHYWDCFYLAMAAADILARAQTGDKNYWPDPEQDGSRSHVNDIVITSSL